MKIHHLSCGSFCLPKLPFIKTSERRFCCHCLLIETSEGLVLVDSGFSTADLKDVSSRLGFGPYLLGLENDPAQTALHQIQAMGFSPADVRHIVVTHLDPDHVGGIQDFPEATVHLYRNEYDGAREAARRNPVWAHRFREVQWKNWKKWELYDYDGETWEGFRAVRPLRGLSEKLALISLEGHTQGHCGVAVDAKLLHAGDAYYHRAEILSDGAPSPLTSGFARLLAFNNQQRLLQLERLKELQAREPEIRIFCSHDREEFLELKHHG